MHQYEIVQDKKQLRPDASNTVAKKIGIEKMRQQCKVFNNWITRLEGVADALNNKR